MLVIPRLRNETVMGELLSPLAVRRVLSAWWVVVSARDDGVPRRANVFFSSGVAARGMGVHTPRMSLYGVVMIEAKG